ncbi:MAG TPA: DinB family protein [Thermoanaerobaculaceae bacterium]|nr:DinB family protein [Thermoanaerobaculaceae bacterium]
MNDTTLAITGEARRLFLEYLDKIERSAGALSAEQIWWRPNAACNSVGNLLLHLAGNLSQWVLAGLGGRPYERHRPEEFAAAGGQDGAALLARLRGVVEACCGVVQALTPEDLQRTLVIQGTTGSGFAALLHTVEHMSYHTGQIVHITKELLGEQGGIEFYPHLK